MVRTADGPLPGWGQVLTQFDEPLLILGTAGSGKTALVEHRFCALVERGTRVERLAVVVPSPGRADALRARLEARLEQGYEQLHVLTPLDLAELLIRRHLGGDFSTRLTAADRLAMMVERIDQLPLEHHDFGGNANALLGTFVRRIDRLKAENVSASRFSEWAEALPSDPESALQREFAAIYRTHERMLAEAGARDAGDVVLDALRVAGGLRADARPFAHVLVDDAQQLELTASRLVRKVAAGALTATGDPGHGLRVFRGAAAARLRPFAVAPTLVVELEGSLRCPPRLLAAARSLLGEQKEGSPAGEPPLTTEVEFWRCSGERAQAQGLAADVERLTAREGVPPGEIAVLVPDVSREGQAVAVALEERALPYRVVGEGAFFQRVEIRDLLAWLRLLADPSDAAAVVRALARPPIELRSVDIARCTQIARRRKLDMVAGLAAATESPQVPPEARERIRVFLKLYRSSMGAVDTTRPDLYVHRLIERLGLRRQQLFAAQADVVERLQALARFGELAAAYVAREPQATPREFARSIAAVADFGLREPEEPDLSRPPVVQVLALDSASGLEASHIYVVGLHGGMALTAPEPVPDELLEEELPADDEATRAAMMRQSLYVAVSRARKRAVLCYPAAGERGGLLAPAPPLEGARQALAVEWQEKPEELFGPGETLHATYRLLRDELMEGTTRAAGRLGELRFDTDLDVSHAVVRYLELLKVAALIARPEDQSLSEALRDVNARILQAVTAEQREIFLSSVLDDYLLDAERDARRRAQALAARDEPSLEPFLPKRGEGVILSASDIDTYRACPLKYKFARVFRIPQEPTIHQRFGILVHQVLERYHAVEGEAGSLAQLLGLLDAGWQRGGFGESDEERQLRGKAAAALTRYHERFQSEESEPVWFERQFTFKLGPHMLRGRVDRVDRLPGGEYELIDYKTGRPKSAAQLAEDVQLSLYAVGAREAWELESSRQAYYYLLDDQKVEVPMNGAERAEWVTTVALEVAEGIQSQGFEPTPSYGACSVCDYRLICPAAER